MGVVMGTFLIYLTAVVVVLTLCAVLYVSVQLEKVQRGIYVKLNDISSQVHEIEKQIPGLARKLDTL